MKSEARRDLGSFIRGYWDAWRYLRDKSGTFQLRTFLRFPIGVYRYTVRILGGRLGYLTGWVE